MLARRSTINHPLVGQIDLPLLVPAFSSKGFDFHTKGRGKKKTEFSEVAYELAEFGQYPAGSVLVSAYDLHFDHFNTPELPKNRPEDYLRNASLVFLDSGGYELSSDFDLTESRKYEYTPKDGFTESDYREILNKSRDLKQPLPLIISNFDYGTKRKPLSEQIESARSIFRDNPNAMSDFILKPWTRDSKMVDPERLSENDIKMLRGFDIIGVTEKDLGKNLFDRIKAIASLRHKLDSVGIDAPIHIWGGLDPVSTPLFFFAGAQIFDGISWLRYAFFNGVAIYRECSGVLKGPGVSASKQLVHAYANIDNRSFMHNMELKLQQWVDYEGENFTMFDPHVRQHFQDAYGVMCSKISYLKGDR